MTTFRKIVVGVDGSNGSRVALRRAADEAEQHGAELTVVTAWVQPVPYGAGVTAVPYVSEPDPAVEAADLLDDTVTEVLGAEPAIPVHPRVVPGSAAHALIELSEDADLLVVGTRGLGGFAGLLLGSVSHQVVAHARCPVMVVR